MSRTAGSLEQSVSWHRYVVQHHTGHGPDHYDFMLEQGDRLWTWQLDQPPDAMASSPAPARRIGDHRLAYLTYEGPVSGGRGHCRIVDRGRFRLRAESPDRLRLELADGKAGGAFDLVLVDRDEGLWRLSRSAAADGA